ncbi:MAG: hypothetical protein ACLR7U_12190 [Ruthenibacterium lactatiformans]
MSGHAGCTCQGCPCAARRIYEAFTREQFVSFVFGTMMSMLRADREDASFLQEVVCRLIY